MMKRIAILGRGGAGKSTLASYLATRYKLPVFELDQYFWDEDLTPCLLYTSPSPRD